MATTIGSLSLVTAPTSFPITCEIAQEYGRVSKCEDDATISRLIVAATSAVEAELGRQLMTATYDYILDRLWPEPIEIPLPPLQSVTSFTYVDIAGVTQTLDTSVYVVDGNREPGIVYRAFNEIWPSTRGDRNDVTIRFVAGYTSAANVPEEAKVAIAMLVNQMYDMRIADVDKSLITTPQYQRLMWSLKVPEFV